MGVKSKLIAKGSLEPTVSDSHSDNKLNLMTAKGFVVSFEYEMLSPLTTRVKGEDAVYTPNIGALGV